MNNDENQQTSQNNLNAPFDTLSTNLNTNNSHKNSDIILESKIYIQRNLSYYSIKPGVMRTDGNKIIIARDDGKKTIEINISKIKYIKTQLSIIYIYVGFKVYTINFATPNFNYTVSNSLSRNIAATADMIARANLAKPECDKWIDLFTQKNIKFISNFRQVYIVLRNFILLVMLFFIIISVGILILE